MFVHFTHVLTPGHYTRNSWSFRAWATDRPVPEAARLSAGLGTVTKLHCRSCSNGLQPELRNNNSTATAEARTQEKEHSLQGFNTRSQAERRHVSVQLVMTCAECVVRVLQTPLMLAGRSIAYEHDTDGFYLLDRYGRCGPY
jgi:hypothetical protein